MRVVVQAVDSAAVDIEKEGWHRSIGRGLVAFVGVADSDGDAEAEWMARKLAGLRIFPDGNGRINLSVADIAGSVLSVSQFTLFADVRKGARPNFSAAGEPTHAKEMWLRFNRILARKWNIPVETGLFATDMKVSLVNHGPMTIVIDTDAMMGRTAKAAAV